MSNDSQIIQRYYQFELSKEELDDFQVRMNSDEEFAHLVLQYHGSQKTAADFYHSKEDHQRTQRWKSIIQDDVPLEAVSPGTSFSYRRIAAIVALLIGIGSVFFLFSDNDQAKWDHLVAEAKGMNPELELETLRGVDSADKEKALIQDAYSLYLSGDYSSAILLFNKVAKESKYFSEAIYFTALCHYQTKEYDQFFSLLNASEQHLTTSTQQHLSWYTGLIYLEQQEIDKATNTFKDLSATDSELGNKSKKLLTKISATSQK